MKKKKNWIDVDEEYPISGWLIAFWLCLLAGLLVAMGWVFQTIG